MVIIFLLMGKVFGVSSRHLFDNPANSYPRSNLKQFACSCALNCFIWDKLLIGVSLDVLDRLSKSANQKNRAAFCK